MHGYAIAREIERRSLDSLSFQEGSIYPALRALEADGFVESEWQTPERGPARKVYRLVPRGSAELVKRKATWRELVASIDQVLGGNIDVQPA